MTLDLVRIAEQMPALMSRLVEERARGRERLRAARSALSRWAADAAAWRLRLEAARTRWPLALPLAERADRGYRPPPCPAAYAALAVDGSHIDVDRNAPAPCYVLNLGWSAIFYGVDRPPELDSHAELQPATAALVEWDEEDASREYAIRGEVLSLLRGVRELALLAERAALLPPDLPQVALLDGNLGLWNVAQAPISRHLRERFIRGEGGLLPALTTLRALAGARPLAVGAYTSAAGTADVVHALRVGTCPLEEVACTRCPRQPPVHGAPAAPPAAAAGWRGSPAAGYARPCDVVGVGTDAELFLALLAPGERSALFLARSSAFLRPDAAGEPLWYEAEGHAVAFFYLRVADEIARVELPLWVAQAPERIGLLHAALLDQCAKGPAYPVVLQEAHEQAVITTVDRLSFAALLERELERAGEVPGGSAKARSKRIRRL
jgi:hypothetical protein